jgi:uncharacterized RDD family membrane protein YckC
VTVGGLVSGEGVALELSHAGLGSRIVAALIDFVLQLVALFFLFVVDGLSAQGDPDIVAALAIIELVLVVAVYPIVSEWLGRGRTVGKLVMGLRVVRDDGGPIGFRQALVRGLAGLLLEKPGLVFPLSTAAGMITMAASTQSKRIGDMMAGTFVLSEHVGLRRGLEPAPLWVPYELQPWAAALDLSRLDDRLAHTIRQFVVRAHAMTPAAQDWLGRTYCDQVLAVTWPPPPAGTPPALVLVSVLAERRRRAEWAAIRQ